MDSYSLQPQNHNRNTFGPPAQLYLPPQNHKKTALIVALCVAAVVLAAVLGGVFYHTHSAAYRVRKGFLNLMRETEEMRNPLAEKIGADEVRRMLVEEGAHLDTRMNVTTDTFLGQITLGVDTDCEIDRREKEMAASTSVSVMNYELASLEMYGDRENLCFSIPELYLENIYIENENVLDQYNHSMWAEVFGKAAGDDFSIDLFPEAWLFGDEEGVGKAFIKEYADEIAECRRHMTIEKAGKELYRVSFDELYFNELVRQFLYDYVDFSKVGREDAMGMLSYFDVISNVDEISFLLEINGANRIESIRVEEPLSLCGGRIRLSGDIYFLGEKRGIEKMQGMLEVKSGRQEEKKMTEIVWQTTQSLELDDYQMETDIKCSFMENGQTQNWRFGCDLECDGRKNSFDGKISMKDAADGFEVVLEASGGFSHITKGESFDLELDEVLLYADGEELVLVRGDVGLSPLKRSVRQNVKAKTAFFELSEYEWNSIFDRVYRNYEYLLESMYGMYW
ncbi:MAG: hypothetical protein K2K90_05470 [Lachnospiraceae bacterium]|nr:hypothetical protein [Lachnospiraceae bacterium]